MAAEDFFNRWSKRKAEAGTVQSEPAAAAPTASPATVLPTDEVKVFPTLDDVAGLNNDSDFKPFLAKGIDENVKRSAMKKLFADPHFNLMDGLDTYIDDYNKFEPIPPEMLPMLNHAKALLNPLTQFEKPLQNLLELEAAFDPENAADAAGNGETASTPLAPTVPVMPAPSTEHDAPTEQEPVSRAADPVSTPSEPFQGQA